jgi:membrane protein implicated in regulation of membrane protease activity
MRRTQLIATLAAFGVVLLVFAPAAFATGGEGFYGETSDKSVTNAMFITIAFFPVVITLFSLIQWRLEKRRHARMDAEKRRAASADWRGGW